MAGSVNISLKYKFKFKPMQPSGYSFINMKGRTANNGKSPLMAALPLILHQLINSGLPYQYRL
jgi:hypothetical protein